MSGSPHCGRDRRDAGFTLAELLVALVLFGLVLGLAYMSLSALAKANDLAMRESTFARNITYPINQFEKYAMQNESITYADPYTFEFWEDLHNNDTPDLVKFWTDSSGKLFMSIQRYNSTRTAKVGTAPTVVLSSDNANVAQGQPLFVYYKKDGAAISSSSTSTIPAMGDSVRITVVVKYKTSTEESLMQSFGAVTFRNRTY